FAMVEERNELCNRPFEIDVIFPERVIGIDEQSLGAVLLPHLLMITGRGGFRMRGCELRASGCERAKTASSLGSVGRRTDIPQSQPRDDSRPVRSPADCRSLASLGMTTHKLFRKAAKRKASARPKLVAFLHPLHAWRRGNDPCLVAHVEQAADGFAAVVAVV